MLWAGSRSPARVRMRSDGGTETPPESRTCMGGACGIEEGWGGGLAIMHASVREHTRTSISSVACVHPFRSMHVSAENVHHSLIVDYGAMHWTHSRAAIMIVQ